MKLTEKRLKRIIKEELNKIMNESEDDKAALRDRFLPVSSMMMFPSWVVVDGGDPKSFKDYLQDDIEIDEGVMEMLNMPGQKKPGIKGRNIIPLAVMDSVLVNLESKPAFEFNTRTQSAEVPIGPIIKKIKTKYEEQGVTAKVELAGRPQQQGEE